MFRYRYIGNDKELIGHTSLGKFDKDTFYVQVDDFKHPYSKGWHVSSREDWVLNEYPWTRWEELQTKIID